MQICKMLSDKFNFCRMVSQLVQLIVRTHTQQDMMGRLLIVLICVQVVHVAAQSSIQTDYDGDHTIEDCLQTFTTQYTQNPSFTCSMVEAYVKCIIRVSKLYTYPIADSRYTDFDKQLNDLLRKLGLECKFDMHSVSEEVAREQNYKNADYDGDHTIEDCLQTFTTQYTQNPSFTCSMVEAYVKCLVRVSKLYTYPFADSRYTDFDKQLNDLLRKLGRDCKFDMHSVSEEVAREQNYKNADPGFKPKSPWMLILLLAWTSFYMFHL